MATPCTFPELYADSHDLGSVHDPLRSIIWTAQHYYAPHGPGGLLCVSGQRTDFQQKMLRRSHGCGNGRECDRTCKGSPTTAVPGRSNHRNISDHVAAVDLGGLDLDWLGANQAMFGLHRPVKGEKWHFERNWSIDPSVAIVPYGGEKPKPPRAWAQINDGDTDRTVFLRGGQEFEVTEVQLRLIAMAVVVSDPKLDPGDADGWYGHDSQVAINNFKKRVVKMQQEHGLPVWSSVDSIVGPKTIDMLRFLNP